MYLLCLIFHTVRVPSLALIIGDLYVYYYYCYYYYYYYYYYYCKQTAVIRLCTCVRLSSG